MSNADLSFSAQDLGPGKFSFKWDDLYIDKSGSPKAEFGGDLFHVGLGADYVLKGGLLATIEGDLGDADISYNIDIPDFKPSQVNGTAVIDTAGWSVSSGLLNVTSFDPSSFYVSADVSADVELAVSGSLSSHLSVHTGEIKTKNPLYSPNEWIEETLKTKNPLYSPNEWIEDTLKTKNPLYSPNEWIEVDLGWFGSIKTKNPLYSPNEWIEETFKTKNPLYSPNEWIEETVKTKNPLYNPTEWIVASGLNIEQDLIPKQEFSTGKIIDIEGTKNLFSLDASHIEPVNFDFEYGKITAKIPNQITSSSSSLIADGDGLPNIVTFGSTPVMTASVDILKLIASAFGVPPQALSGEKSLSIGDNINFGVDYSLLKALASANVDVGQRTEFTPEQVLVTMKASNGEIKTGVLGDAFNFTAPSSGNGDIKVDATYTLVGSVKTDIGLVTGASFDLNGMSFGVKADLKANVLGYNVDEHWDQDVIPPVINESFKIGNNSNLEVLFTDVDKYEMPSINKSYTISYNNGIATVVDAGGSGPSSTSVETYSTINYQNANSGENSSGMFVEINANEWVENNQFHFKEVIETKNTVVLFDESRSTTVTLHLDSQKVDVSWDSNLVTWDVTGMSQAEHPVITAGWII